MKILILGQGGREHALAWKISQSPDCQQVYIAPGNGGTEDVGINLDVDINNAEAVLAIVDEFEINMIVIGPEAPLAIGLADTLRSSKPGLAVIGPGKKGAKLEASKAFAKVFMQKHNIPTAGYKTLSKDDLDIGHAYIDAMKTPIVLKADGLAAGKGVIICDTHEEAKSSLSAMLNGQFGEASAQVVIEEFLNGREYSVFILTNGDAYYLLPVAKDYKRIGEGDHGLNTGGMGAVSPVSYVDDSLMQKTIDQVIEPTLQGLKAENIPYTGFIFFGMIEVNGEPYVIEYNCRMGDPETEVVIPRIESDLVQHLQDTVNNEINSADLQISSSACTTVMLVSGGYPLAYEKGKLIEGYENVSDSILFHAGTKRADAALATNGGRVIAVTARASDPAEALKICYEDIKQIQFAKQYYRSDIGFDL